MSTPSTPLVDDNAASVTVYSARSVSWDQTTIKQPDGTSTVIEAGVIYADAVLEERHDDDAVITENPVEFGSVTNDHAYDLQRELELTYAFSPASKRAQNSPTYLTDIYQQFLNLKRAKVLCNVVTGKDATYQNMLVKSVSETTDRDTENILMLRIGMRQVLITFTQTVTIAPASQQSMPQKTAPTINSGAVSLQSAPNYTQGQ